MTYRWAIGCAAAAVAVACGGSEFDSAGTGGSAGSAAGGSAGATGGSAGATGGSAGATGGSAGATGGSAGATGGSATGGSAGATGGSAGATGGSAGATGGSAGGGTGGTGGSAGPITIVNSTLTKQSKLDVPTLSMLPTPQPGNAIIVGVTCFSEVDNCTILASGVTDNRGNTYTLVKEGESVVSSTTHGARGYLFITENIASPGGPFTISIDPNGSVPPDYQLMAYGAIEVSGLAPPLSLDASGSTLVGSGTSTTASTDLATTQANELAVAVLTMRSNDTNMLITPDPTWITHQLHQNGASGPPGHCMVSKVLTSTGIVSHTWTHDTPTRGAAGIIATFKGAAN